MKDSFRLQLQRLVMRLAELDAHLTDPKLSQDINRYRAVAREQAEAQSLVDRFHAYERREADEAAALVILAETTRAGAADADIAEMAREEITLPGPIWRSNWRPCKPRCCRAIRTMCAMPLLKSVPGRGVMSRPCLPAIWCACTCGFLSAVAGAPS